MKLIFIRIHDCKPKFNKNKSDNTKNTTLKST